jgi:hypothetical protein
MAVAAFSLKDLAAFIEARRAAVAAGIVCAGCAAALFIYVTAPPPGDLLGARLEDSKVYLRQMEVYGGKANVLAYELREKFAALWHGRALAFTVAGLSALLALAVFSLFRPPPPNVDPGRAVRAGQGKPDP